MIRLGRGLVVVVALSAAAHAEIVVRLADAVVGGPEVRLGDVATIEGATAAEAAALRQISLGAAPRAARSRRVNPEYVRAIVLAEGVGEVRVEGTATVRRAADSIPADRLRAAVLEALAPHLPAGGRLEFVRIPDDAVVPAGADLRVIPPAGAARGLRGRQVVSIEITAPGHRESRQVAVEVRVEEPVLVAARALERGRAIEPADARIEVRDVTWEARRALRDPAEAAGKRLRRPVAEGSVIGLDDLEEIPAVRAGERVRIVARLGGVEIAAAGEARASGAIGATIPVRNESSRRIVQARVAGPGEVVVE